MAGITRYLITDIIRGSGAGPFADSGRSWGSANELYQSIYKSIGMELEPGDITVTCSKSEFEAGYDYALEIDTMLYKNTGRTIHYPTGNSCLPHSIP